MATYNDRERFIPYQKFELVNMITKDISPESQKDFKRFCRILESVYHFKFHEKLERMKQCYYPFNPDIDTQKSRRYKAEELEKSEDELEKLFSEVLNDANYKKIEEDELQEALIKESLFKISLFVDFDQFDKCLLFCRGDVTNKVVIRRWNMKKKTIEVPTYKRIAMLIKFCEKEDIKVEDKNDILFKPGTMIVKLFRNIPKADMEMLFPNTKVRMRLKDKLLIGVPAVLGGLGILLTKGGTILYALPLLISIFYILATSGDFSTITSAQIAALIAAGTALLGIGAYAWRQWVKYRSRKIEFMKTLSENLYFKNLDNNAGVFHHLVDSAEEEECKEVMLSYYFLLQNPQGITEIELDDRIESWFQEKHKIHIDFEIDDALKKLEELGLCTKEGEGENTVYKAISITEGCKKLDYLWDNYFQYNE
ncbi:TMEM143 family protein [Candidatus Uabimicrobium sp. HlEnr_7]|uniref:TMEM143 family protein n=1 Tax=Candidatus Uabimicrobium helgolandensis TaxID=3095367 RepID=UPI0035583919